MKDGLVRVWVMCLLVSGVLLSTLARADGQEALPRSVAGTWRITRVLPVRPGSACWTEQQAGALVGSTVTYTAASLRWQGGVVPLTGVTTRMVGAAELAEEELRGDRAVTLAELGFARASVREVNLQHEDADVMGATTEVPGDSVLIGEPGRLVLSACGVYLEARRVGGMGADRPVVRAPERATASTEAGRGGAAGR